MKKKRSVTLIEMMIVILLIGIIGGTLAFNMRGSMDQGRAFKTEHNIERVHDILMLEYANGDQTLKAIKSDWKKYVESSPLIKNADEVIKDGWRVDLKVSIVDDDIVVTSNKLNAYKEKKKSK